MPNVVDGLNLKLATIEWSPCWRIISTRYPPIHFYERIIPKQEWELLLEIEQRTNPRILDEIGQIQLIRPEDRKIGPGWGWVNAAFTFLNPEGSRFSDGTYGVYYAGKELETAIAETKYHRERLYSDTNNGPFCFEMAIIKANLSGQLHDLRPFKESEPMIYDPNPDNYGYPQVIGKALHNKHSYGIVYESVRRHEGQCVALFRPTVLDKPQSGGYLVYEWDGKEITRIYEKQYLSMTTFQIENEPPIVENI